MAWLYYTKNLRGVPVPGIWHDTNLNIYGKPRACLHSVPITPEDAKLPLDLLARLHPLPEQKQERVDVARKS